MAMKQRSRRLKRLESELEPARVPFLDQELLEKHGGFGQRGGLPARQEHLEFVAQSQQTRGFQADDGQTSLNERPEGFEHPPGLGACAIDQPDR